MSGVGFEPTRHSQSILSAPPWTTRATSRLGFLPFFGFSVFCFLCVFYFSCFCVFFVSSRHLPQELPALLHVERPQLLP